ncbi:MAG: hypothetical protein AUH86_02310 [Acidobacteria bacterium 13_1_40CM_4_58_4]|nr:MAG: hypothetical protein AUH86_02310 [Acidobacteria bacterium 13_1_40CM_4_58_4]
MALVPIKTASETGYCDCICGCYELASLRDEDTGKGYCPACAKDHLELNAGVGLPNPAPVKLSPNAEGSRRAAPMPVPADPPAKGETINSLGKRKGASRKRRPFPFKLANG